MMMTTTPSNITIHKVTETVSIQNDVFSDIAIRDNLTKSYFAETIIPLSQSIHKDIMECKKYQKMIYAKLLSMD